MPATANPTTPSSYISGSLALSANTVYNLLALIQTTLDYACPGACEELNLYADTTNPSPILIGQQTRGGSTSNTTGLALSSANFGYSLSAGASRTYRSSYPGNQCPISQINIFCTSAATLHVEIAS